MIKIIKALLIIIIIFGAAGYGVFYFGTNIASEKIVDAVSTNFENNGQLDEVKEILNNDPDIQQYVEENAFSKENNLPFTTKEQATRVIIQKVGITKLQDIQSKVQNGITNNEVEELLQDIKGKLSEEELVALKVIAYKELNK